MYFIPAMSNSSSVLHGFYYLYSNHERNAMMARAYCKSRQFVPVPYMSCMDGTGDLRLVGISSSKLGKWKASYLPNFNRLNAAVQLVENNLETYGNYHGVLLY